MWMGSKGYKWNAVNAKKKNERKTHINRTDEASEPERKKRICEEMKEWTNGWNDGDTSIQITQTRNTSIKSIYLDFVHSFIFVLWHNDVTKNLRIFLWLLQFLPFFFIFVRWWQPEQQQQQWLVVVVMMPSPISYYLTRMETKRGQHDGRATYFACISCNMRWWTGFYVPECFIIFSVREAQTANFARNQKENQTR